jgi:hypothetical protein
MISLSTSQGDPDRPIELVTVVLRAAVQGLLKCCDMAWRELARGGAYDVRPFLFHNKFSTKLWQTEDWQSDKCDVLLLEGMPVPFVVSQLDDAMGWLFQATESASCLLSCSKFLLNCI